MRCILTLLWKEGMWKCLLDVNTESRETGSSGLGLWIYTVSALGSPTSLQNDREKYSIADSRIIFIRMFLLKHVTVNATTVKRKNWSKWLICQRMLRFYEHSLPWNITILKWRSFISVSRLKMQTFKVHTSPKHHSENGSQCYNTSKDESKCHSKPHTSIKRLELTFQSWF